MRGAASRTIPRCVLALAAAAGASVLVGCPNDYACADYATCSYDAGMDTAADGPLDATTPSEAGASLRGDASTE
jgi:hypothetical protein